MDKGTAHAEGGRRTSNCFITISSSRIIPMGISASINLLHPNLHLTQETESREMTSRVYYRLGRSGRQRYQCGPICRRQIVRNWILRAGRLESSSKLTLNLGIRYQWDTPTRNGTITANSAISPATAGFPFLDFPARCKEPQSSLLRRRETSNGLQQYRSAYQGSPTW